MLQKSNFSSKYDPKINEFIKHKEAQELEYMNKNIKDGHYHEVVNSFFNKIGYTLEYNTDYINSLEDISCEFYNYENKTISINKVKSYLKYFKIFMTVDKNCDVEIRCNYGDFKAVRKSLITDVMKIVNDFDIENSNSRTLSQRNIWDWVENKS